MFDGLSTQTLEIYVALAAGVGAVIAALISGVIGLIKDGLSNRRQKAFQNAERENAKSLIEADRAHQLKLLEAQFAAQRVQEIERIGRDAASNLLELLGEIESTWKLEESHSYLEVDSGTIKRAKRATFRLPDQSIAEYVHDGLQMLQHAWIGARTFAVENSDRSQRRDLKRMQLALSGYIAGEAIYQAWVDEQKSDMRTTDELWNQYFASPDH